MEVLCKHQQGRNCGPKMAFNLKLSHKIAVYIFISCWFFYETLGFSQQCASSPFLNRVHGFGNSANRFLSASSIDMMKGAGLGDVVTVDFSVQNEDGSTFEHTFDQGRVRFVVGGGGFFPALHDEVVGRDPGEEASVLVSPEDAYGEWNEELAAMMEKQGMKGLEVGAKVRLWTGDTGRVTWANETHVLIDTNPPLAGKSFRLNLKMIDIQDPAILKTATFAGGCFWGMELAFQRVPGVISTKVGYTQGTIDEPTYEEVCSGRTGHAEAVEVMYDSLEVTYKQLLEVFFGRHNPTQLNYQGNDIGTQYRSGVYYHDEAQLSEIKNYLQGEQNKYQDQIVTEIRPASMFWSAEDYHQQYLEKGGQKSKKNEDEKIRCYG